MGELNPTLELSGGNGPTTGLNGTYNIICSPLSIEALGEKYFDYDIFPNPANEMINVRFKHSEVSYNEALIEIYDLNGRLILQENCILHEQSQQSFNIQELNKGLYIIRLQADGFQLLKKFIKQ
jgi:hypothetical protein